MPDDDAPGALHQATPGGVIADHSPPGLLPVNIAPTTTSDQNVVVAALIPLACFRIEDIRFAFDSSAVLPGIAAEIPLLAKLRDRHTLRAPDRPDAAPPISLFGHADPVGQDDYNKSLAGRRATAIYALLTRAPDLWEKLFSHPIAGSGDRWGSDTLDVMANTVDPAQAAQRSQAARNSAGARSALFLDYMNKIAGSFRLAKEDFLGRGADPDGKADYQGCGEFNPVLLFSREDERVFQKPENRDDRNDRNAPNRRVMALLFRPLTRVNIDKWPCPRATEGKAKCLTRFWSDADVRRNTHLPGQERRFEDTHDTFACRFYHRLTTLSPCERVLPRLNATVEIILDNDDNHAVDASEPAAQFVRVGLWDHAFDPATAAVRDNPAEDQNFIGLDSRGPEARRFYFRVNDPNAAGQPQVSLNWRTEFGVGGNDDAPASQAITLLPTAADPAVFVSHSVFLVADFVDQVQPTDSGLPAGNPDVGSRGLTQSNHRIRRITVDDTHRLDTNVVADYTSLLGGQTSRVTVPLFRRSPDERLKMRVHLINVRTAVGGPPLVNPARIAAAKSTLRSVYACTGIFLDIDEVQIDPPASCTGWLARFPGDPLAIGADPAVELPPIVNNLLVPSTSQLDLIKLVHRLSNFDSNDLYLVYVSRIFATPLPAPPAKLTIGLGGISFPDSFTDSASPARGFCFIGVHTVPPLTDPHEMTHITTNLRNNNGGHFSLSPPGILVAGAIEGRNLMLPFAAIQNNNPLDSKRLWDSPFTNPSLTPSVIPPQITAIRNSRFVRPL